MNRFVFVSGGYDVEDSVKHHLTRKQADKLMTKNIKAWFKEHEDSDIETSYDDGDDWCELGISEEGAGCFEIIPEIEKHNEISELLQDILIECSKCDIATSDYAFNLEDTSSIRNTVSNIRKLANKINNMIGGKDDGCKE